MTQGVTNGQGGSAFKPPSTGLAGGKKVGDMYRALTSGDMLPQGDATVGSSFHREAFLKIDTPMDGGGFYNAKAFQLPKRLPNGTLDATESILGILPTRVDAIFLNVGEIGTSDHGLSPETIVVGRILGFTADGKKMIVYGVTGGGADPQLQYQGMIYQAITDNQMGGDFLCSHAMEII